MTISKLFYSMVVFITLIFLYSCSSDDQPHRSLSDPLPSWNESTAKTNIMEFVKSVTTEGGDFYIAPVDRVVVFDNDGTLWTEQPLPNQIYFTMDRIRQMALTDPGLASEMPYRAVIENDTAELAKFQPEDVITIVGKVNAAKSLEDFDKVVNAWIDTAQHPRYGRRFDQTVYAPMLELLEYLRSHDFQIFIVSGGSVEFMRAFAQRVYGISTDHVIGSRMQLETVRDGDSIDVERKPQFAFNDDKDGKVESIAEFIGRRPIMVVGNSDGDLAMMEYTSQQDRRTLEVFVLHNDGTREYDYADGVIAGSLVEGMRVAGEREWTIVNMKTDWKTIFGE